MRASNVADRLGLLMVHVSRLKKNYIDAILKLKKFLSLIKEDNIKSNDIMIQNLESMIKEVSIAKDELNKQPQASLAINKQEEFDLLVEEAKEFLKLLVNNLNLPEIPDEYDYEDNTSSEFI